MKTSTRKQMTKAVLLFTAIFLTNTPALAATYRFEGIPAVSHDHLDTMRGGFITRKDMVISLGIKTATIIDGVLQVVNTMNIPDLKTIRGHHGNFANVSTWVRKSMPSSLVPDTEPVVPTQDMVTQNSGTGNGETQTMASQTTATDTVSNHADDFAPIPATDNGSSLLVNGTLVRNSGFSTLIQNSLDKKTIQNLTIIDTTVTNSDLIRQINLMSRINEQLINSMH